MIAREFHQPPHEVLDWPIEVIEDLRILHAAEARYEERQQRSRT